MPNHHRFNQVEREELWAKVLDVWSARLQALWDFCEHDEAPWGWKEKTNLALFLSAFEKAMGEDAFSMIELPTKRPGREHAGQFDFWFGTRDGWDVCGEAKHIWVFSWDGDNHERIANSLEQARVQCSALEREAETVVTLAFIVPTLRLGRTWATQSVLADFNHLRDEIWTSFGKDRQGSFDAAFHVPQEQLSAFASWRKQYPGVILLGHIHDFKAK